MCDACLLLVSSSSCELQESSESSVVSKLKVHFFTSSCLELRTHFRDKAQLYSYAEMSL